VISVGVPTPILFAFTSWRLRTFKFQPHLLRHLQVMPNTLAKWRVTGEGPAFIHAGRVVRYSPRELTRYIEHQTRRSTSEM
jgi:hypothetical protein